MTQVPTEMFGLTVSDIVIISLMIVVFILAVLLPYPEEPERRGR